MRGALPLCMGGGGDGGRGAQGRSGEVCYVRKRVREATPEGSQGKWTAWEQGFGLHVCSRYT